VLTAINQVLDDTLELRAYELRVRGIDVRREYDDSLPDTMADAHQLQQVFLNLITNAEQAMEQRDGHHHHRLTVRTRRTADAIRIEIEDTGAGIPPNLIERIFNPFFTTKPTGSGTGLGLSISLGIVREHEGRIWAENGPQTGARFVVEVPVTEPRSSGEHATVAQVQSQASDRLRVLVVDDEHRSGCRSSATSPAGARGRNDGQWPGCAHAPEGLEIRRRDRRHAHARPVRRAAVRAAAQRRPAHAERVIFTTGDLVNEQMRRFLDGTAGLASPSPSSSLLSIKHCPRRAAARNPHPEGWARHNIILKDFMRPLLILLVWGSLVSPLAAQEPFDFYSRGPYRPAVPRPEAITGYAAGEQQTMYAVMQHYLDTLVATASDRVRIETWGRTAEYRPIRALIISDPANWPSSIRSAPAWPSWPTRARRPPRGPRRLPRRARPSRLSVFGAWR